MGPSESAGKKVNAPTIRTVPTRRTEKTGRRPENCRPCRGTAFSRQVPGQGEDRDDHDKAPEQHGQAEGGVVPVGIGGQPGKGAAVVAGAEENAYSISLKPCGPVLFKPARPQSLTTAQAVKPRMLKISSITTKTLTFTS